MSTPPSQQTGDADERRAPDSPTELSGPSWFGVLKRTVKEFRADNLTDWAAALTYYGILALFPALLVLLSIVGLLGQSVTNTLIDNLSTVAPGPAKDIITSGIRNLQSTRGAAGILFFVGLGLALWSASGYIGAFIRASNAIYEVPEGRPFWKLRPLQLIVTLVMVVMLVVIALAVVLTGGLARQAGDLVGIGSTAVTVWDIAKWPVLIILVSLMIAILYWAAPNVRHPGFRWVTPGGVVAVLVWIVASAAFALYVAKFSNYNKTYGALGGVIIFLIWLWISNLAVLFGAELDAEVARARQIRAGQPADKEPILPPRDTKKTKS